MSKIRARRRKKAVPGAVVPGGSAPSGPVDVVRFTGGFGAFGYDSQRKATHDGRSASAASGAVHQEYDVPRLRDQARQFERDDSIFQGLTETAGSYIVGSGYALQAQTESAEWNSRIEALFRSYWNGEDGQDEPDIRGLLSGPAIEEMICKELLVVGDVGVIKTKGGKLQLVEAEQIVSTRQRDGIEKDKWGRPTKYFVAPWGKSGAPDASRAREYTPDEFLFITRPRRPSETRSAPPLQANFAMHHRINATLDAEAFAMMMLSRIALSVTRQNAAASAYNESKEDDAIAGTDTTGKASSRITEFDWGLIFHAEPGEEIKGVERNIPGKDFEKSIRVFLRMLGLTLGMPLELIFLDWTQSNYSQSRAVLVQVFARFLRWQILLERRFHAPVYRWFVDRMIDAGAIEDRDDKYRHSWIKPAWPWIDQLKEAQAQALKLNRTLCTHGEVLKSLNRDLEETLRERGKEFKAAIALAKEIEKEAGIPGLAEQLWPILAGIELPKTAAPASQEKPQDDDEDKKPEGKPKEGDDE